MRHVISICALLFCCSLTVTHAETSTVLLALPGVQAWTGDFNGMLRRRLIRILVVPSKTYFFLNKGDTLGLTAETGQEFEKWINKRHTKGPYYIEVAFIPTRRDRIFQELKDGKGDIAAANLTITQERTAIVDFAKPWAKDVTEILVTGPSAPPITAILDLGGREVMVRASSSFHTHLLALNNRLKSDNRTPIKLVAADENP
jgi:ABC-type amino acid transport substrate-binding protein